MSKISCKNNYTTLEEYVETIYLPRKKREIKVSTYVRYESLFKRILGALGHIPLTKISKCDVTSFYDNLHEEKCENALYKPNEVCIMLLKKNFTRPQTVEKGFGMGTVDALRAGKNVSKNTAEKVCQLLKMSMENLFEVKENEISERTIIHHHRLLYNVFREAEFDELIEKNIMKSVRPPKLTHPYEVKCLNKEQAFEVLQALKAFGEYPYKQILQLIFYTGLRRGEACGLEWSDVDFSAGILSVERSSYYLPTEGIYTDTPKTLKAFRKIAIGEKVENILKEVRKLHREFNVQNGKNKRIFTAPNGEKLNPNAVTKYFHRFVENFDLPQCSVHTLRHTNASILISENLPITAISSRLGHSKPDITFRFYAHQMSEDNKKAAEKIENIF